MKKNTTRYLTQAAVIAALYVVLTYVSSAVGLAYGGVQFRLSEALTILPVFTPAAIPGLTIGCVLGNLGSPMGIVDIVCGAGATLLASLVTYFLKKICVKGIPVLSVLSPVVFNAVIVGLELAFLTVPTGFNFASFGIFALQVGLGELLVCGCLGIPLFILVKKNKELNRLFGRQQ